ncbi:DUF6491 family protein [Novosphingobium aquimarinum]|uniref:DUF6491 family protein n=1 Tax=Novosphingobium aquimarinum TaxID=2682494 RepID=UPI0012EB9461|nr:DUF6491 family protein [Novosphingobium aquimarinum]
MKITNGLAAVLAIAGLSACAQSDTRSASKPVAPAAQVVGEPVDCLQLTSFRSTQIRDDRTIDFMGTGDKVWRNTLPNSCPGLKSADAFTYETSLSQLCNVDIITVLNNFGGRPQRGAGCGLGTFVPVKLAK